MLPMQCYTLSCHSTSKKINIHKTKLKKSYGQTNIDKYKVAANITECHIISKLILQRIIITKFPSQRKNDIQIGPSDVPVLIIELLRFSQGT